MIDIKKNCYFTVVGVECGTKKWKFGSSKKLWSQKWPVWKKYDADPYFPFTPWLDLSRGPPLITLYCFAIFFTYPTSFFSFFLSYNGNNAQIEVSALNWITFKPVSAYFIQDKHASVADVLKFYITEVVVRQSDDGEYTIPQNRQVLLNCIYNTPKYLLHCGNVFKSGVTNFSLEVQHSFRLPWLNSLVNSQA